MPGKRRRNDGTYALERVAFWLSDPRIRDTKATIKAFLLYTHLHAVSERREILPPWVTPRLIGYSCDLRPGTSVKCFNVLLGKRLLGLTPDGRIIVYGIKEWHKNLAWKSDEITLLNQAQTVAVMKEDSSYLSRRDFGRESSGREAGWDLELMVIRVVWLKRFPVHELALEDYDRMRLECKRHEISPEWFIKSLPSDFYAPWTLACSYFDQRSEWPVPVGLDRLELTFKGWQETLAAIHGTGAAPIG